MSKDKKKQMGILGLAIALVVVLAGSIIFVGAVSGWFDDPKISLDEEYYCKNSSCDGSFTNLTAEEYEALINNHKSFVIFVDQGGCHTADRLRGYIEDYSRESGIKFYRIMFADAKDSSLHEYVKYYPSAAIISKGKPVVWLHADSDEDAGRYNNYDEFKAWIQNYL